MRLTSLAAAGGFALLGGCMTYPYYDSFTACDNAAGQCYRGCEDYEGTSGYGACHDDCDYSANQCFNSAYEPYRYSSYSYGYSSPWSGRYGYWYPQSGYSFSYDYYGRSPYYSRYDRRYPYSGHRDDHDDDDRYGRDGGTTGGTSRPYGGRRPSDVTTPPAGQPRSERPATGGRRAVDPSTPSSTVQPGATQPRTAPPATQQPTTTAPERPQRRPRREAPRRPGEPDKDLE